ncbi:F-box protein At5g07610-like [Arachis ipaensis]|uniref:F-box protein At5g07610-like n=1 Tax=Arachis ipaensis TaxID=130454 RepID=UPI0007AF226B|nr:F-box protein At5g07610-like [Arachis ipaensis]
MSDDKELISSSAEAIEGNIYLLTEILVRVPLRDVITFKRVSKRWFSLISDPYFSRYRANIQRTTVSGVFLNPGMDPVDPELTFFYLDKKIRRFRPKIPDNSSQILQSCNGLIMLFQGEDVFMYNPTTGDNKPLPSPFPSFDESPFAFYSLAFDPLRFLGYKLICIFESSKEDFYQTMIYSSDSGVWKHCGSSFSVPYDMDFTHGVYFKNSVYWISIITKTTLRFDLNKECVKDDMPLLPPEPPNHNVAAPSYLNSMRTYSGLSNNRYGYILAPACGYMNLVVFDCEFCISVFRLKEDYSSSSRSWILMQSVDLRRTNLETIFHVNLIENYSSVGYEYSIIHLIEDGEDEMALLLQRPDKVIGLRLKDHTCYDVFDIKIKRNPGHYCSFPGVMGWYRAFEYVESLACV